MFTNPHTMQIQKYKRCISNQIFQTAILVSRLRNPGLKKMHVTWNEISLRFGWELSYEPPIHLRYLVPDGDLQVQIRLTKMLYEKLGQNTIKMQWKTIVCSKW